MNCHRPPHTNKLSENKGLSHMHIHIHHTRTSSEGDLNVHAVDVRCSVLDEPQRNDLAPHAESQVNRCPLVLRWDTRGVACGQESPTNDLLVEHLIGCRSSSCVRLLEVFSPSFISVMLTLSFLLFLPHSCFSWAVTSPCERMIHVQVYYMET